MSCKKFCFSRKDRLIEDSERLALALKVFLRAHRLLKNFTDFLKLRTVKCYDANYDNIPLHGALDVVTTAMESMVCGRMPKKQSQRPGLFRDVIPCTRCREMQDVPDHIVYKVDVILICLQKSCAIENIMCQVKDVLFTLEQLPSCITSERLQTLSFLLKEIMKKLICCGRVLEEPLHNMKTKLILCLVNNFICNWSEKRSRTQPCLRVCRFCDHVVSEVTRQWGTFCCEDAQRFNSIREEWALQQPISGTSKDEPSDDDVKSSHLKSERFVDTDEDYAGVYVADGKRSRTHPSLEASASRRVTDYDPVARSTDGNKSARGLDAPRKLGEFDPAIKHPSARGTSGTSATRRTEASSRNTEPEEGYVARGADKFDRVEGRDLTKTADRTVGGRMRGGVRRSRNIDRSAEHPITPDGREERDDAPYKSEPRRILGYREEGTAVRKMRKIKRDTEEPSWDRSEESGPSGTKFEKGVHRSLGRKRYDRNRSRQLQGTGSSDIEGYEIDRYRSETDDRPRRRKNVGRSHRKGADYEEDGKVSLSDGRMDDSIRKRGKIGGNRSKKIEDVESIYEDQSNLEGKEPERKRGRKRYKGTVPENEGGRRVGKMNDTDDEEKTTGGRGRRKQRRGKDEEMEETADVSKSKEAGGRRRKKADALDSERGGVSRSVDEEGDVLKRDGKRRGRSSGRTEGIDSDIMKKHKGVKTFSTSAEDKSTLESGYQSKKGMNAASKKVPRQPDSSRTADDYSKINEPRYRNRKPRASQLYDVEISHRSPIEYQLSNAHFVQQGWTVLPVARTMRKIVYYQAKPAKPHLNWFEKHRNDGRIYYEDGSTIFLNFQTDGSGEVFYPNGKLAIKVQKPKDREYDMYTVFTPGGKDCMGVDRESQIVAVFDTMGNGAVFDEDGVTRLSYNQIGGIWRDNPAGLPLTWQWDGDEKDSIFKTVYMEKSTTHLEKFLHPPSKTPLNSAKAPMSPGSSRNKDKKVVERKPVVAGHDDDQEEEVESGHDAHENYPEETCHLQVICMRLTDYISLRILNRRNINLQFFAGRKSIRIELGTILNLKKEIAAYFADSSSIDDVLKCKFKKLASADLKSDSSLYNLAEELRKVKKSGRQRKFMVAKYRPFLRAWKKSKTRCRLP